MEIRRARPDDAEAACAVLRRSIVELCRADHQDDAATIAAWLANKTADNVRRWIALSYDFVAVEQDRILGVAAMTPLGEVTLNYVSPDARFCGVSKALVRRLEQEAAELDVATVALQSTATALRFYESMGFRGCGPPVKGFGITSGFPMTKSLERHGRARTTTV